MLDFFTVEYVIDLIIHYYYFHQIFRMNFLFFHVAMWVALCWNGVSFILKHCVGDEKVADYTEIDEKLSTIIASTTR